MKNFFAMFGILAAISMLLIGCGDNNEPSDAMKDVLASEGAKTFTVGFDSEFPPYGFVDKNGDYKGFDLDLARAVCIRNGWTMIPKAIDWAAKDAELNAGTIDCIWNGFTMTPERIGMYTWSKPYVQNAQYIMVKSNSSIKTFADLNGMRVVAQDGSSGAEALEAKIAEFAKANPGFAVKEVIKVRDYLTAKMSLESEAADAVALDSAVAKGFVEKSNGALVILTEPLAIEEYGIGFKLGNTALRDQVQTTLDAMVADGTAAKIVQFWATEEKENGGDGIDFILK